MPFHCMLCNKPVQQALNAICDECKEKDESVSQNLILTGFKVCKSNSIDALTIFG